MNKSDLMWLLHASESQIRKLEKAGLKQKENGLFLLSDVIKFLKDRHKKELQARPDIKSLDQKQVCNFFGISRQTLFQRRRAGLKQNNRKKYNLQNICSFLRTYYRDCASQEFHKRLQTIQKKLSRNFNQSLKFINRARNQ